MEQRKFGIYPLGLGSIIGFMCGDAAASYLSDTENPTEEQIEEAMKLTGGGKPGLGPGQVSDESELLMCLLYALEESRDMLDINCIRKYYNRWAKLERIRNISNKQ